MKNGRSTLVGFVGGATLWLGLSAAACSSGGTNGTGSTTGADGGTNATSSGGGSTSCTTDAQCTPPATTPVNCAAGTCNSVTGTCTFKALDADGDGHSAANCKATNGVAVLAGDDCDDSDANLYPGHAEACTTAGDGGIKRSPSGDANGACKAGQITCQGGVASACVGEVPACPSNETCIGGQCTGQCGQGEKQCSGNSAIQTCQADGTWGAAAACTGGACTEADGGTGNAACGGVCTPGTTQCGSGTSANFVQTCDHTGQWQNAPSACTDVCISGACGGNCSPGQTECGTSNNVLTCPASGTWPTIGGTSCTSQGKACVSTGTQSNPSAQCGGTCVPGVVGACGVCGKGTETCTPAGAQGTCSGDAPATAKCGVCNDGTSTCGGACVGGTTNYNTSCGSCNGKVLCGGSCSISTPGNYNVVCNSCGARYGCDGNCDGPKPSSNWMKGDAGTLNLDFANAHCSANTPNWRWYPDFSGWTTNPSGHYLFHYQFSAHNNMSGSGATIFYIGCSSNPTGGNAHSEFQLQTDAGYSLQCPVADSVVYYPVLCNQSGSCCGDPSVNMDVTSWTSGDAVCQ